MKYKMTYHHWKHTFDHRWNNALQVYWRLRKGKTEIESTLIYTCGFDKPYDDQDHMIVANHPDHLNGINHHLQVRDH